MVSFQKLWENIEKNIASDKSQEAIRTGMNIRDDFWDDFLLLINNSTALSELLEVPVSKIAGWHQKIKAALDSVQQADTVPDAKDKGKMLHTGLPEDEIPSDPHTQVLNPIEKTEGM